MTDDRPRSAGITGYPVWVRLVALVLVPIVGLSFLLARSIAASARLADRTERVGRLTDDLEDVIWLAELVMRERTGSETRARLHELGLSEASAKALGMAPFLDLMAPARSALDAQLAGPEAGRLGDVVDEITVPLSRARAAVDGLGTGSPAEVGDGVAADYAAVLTALDRRQQGITRALIQSPATAESTGPRGVADVVRITELADDASAIVTALGELFIAPSTRADATALIVEVREFEHDLAQARGSGAPWAATIAQIVDNRRFDAFDEAVTAAGRGDVLAYPITDKARALQAATVMASAVRSSAIGEIQRINALAQQRADGATVALARLVILGGAALLLTGLGVAVIARSHAAHLRRLADLAQRITAGDLDGELVTPTGAREVRLVARALNETVHNLRHVERQAAALAEGQIDDPALERPSPGRLGVALHASVARLTAAWRQQEGARAELAHRANHDMLTGLPNRAFARERLEAALLDSRRVGREIAVLFIDLDGFKAVNDRNGHAVGDRLLQEVANRLNGVVRSDDVLARLGGDEFVVIAHGALGAFEIVELGHRLVRCVQGIDRVGDDTVVIGASVGIALAGSSTGSGDDLLAEADAALYAAKRAGKGTVALSPAMAAAVSAA